MITITLNFDDLSLKEVDDLAEIIIVHLRDVEEILVSDFTIEED